MEKIITCKNGHIWEAMITHEDRFFHSIGRTEEEAKEQVKEAILYHIAKKVVEEANKDNKINPASDQIQIVVVEPNKKPYKKTIKAELSEMNDIVNGYIENVFLGLKTSTGAKIGLVVNEEGKLFNLPLCRRIVNYDTLVGTFFITAYNLQGDNVSLSDSDANKLIKQFSSMEVYL